MKINVNKDITKYKREQWKGLSIEQCIKMSAAVLLSSGLVFFLWYGFHVPVFAAVFLVTPITLVTVLFGFFKVNHMSFREYIKVSLRFAKQEPLLFQTLREAEEIQQISGVKEKKKSGKKTEV